MIPIKVDNGSGMTIIASSPKLTAMTLGPKNVTLNKSANLVVSFFPDGSGNVVGADGVYWARRHRSS
jgi:hypothetical protein